MNIEMCFKIYSRTEAEHLAFWSKITFRLRITKILHTDRSRSIHVTNFD